MTVRRPTLLASSALAICALAAATFSGFAQDATPVAETPGAATPVAVDQAATPVAVSVTPRPVHIHSGDCTNLGEVIASLTDLIPAQGDPVGQADLATTAESSYTNVPMTLPDILAAPHAINVHLSVDQIGTYIACGEIGGAIDVNGAVIIGLREVNSSGYTGIAFLSPGIDGLTTDVSVFIAPVFGAAG
ncbi:MAG: hypothetical protein KC442_24545 [Thermomicrobiales bacterium]|nr:hypothetical protein [Thermomicrobiales bacterium]